MLETISDKRLAMDDDDYDDDGEGTQAAGGGIMDQEQEITHG